MASDAVKRMRAAGRAYIAKKSKSRSSSGGSSSNKTVPHDFIGPLRPGTTREEAPKVFSGPVRPGTDVKEFRKTGRSVSRSGTTREEAQEVFSGPVRPGTDVKEFRKTGRSVSRSVSRSGAEIEAISQTQARTQELSRVGSATSFEERTQTARDIIRERQARAEAERIKEERQRIILEGGRVETKTLKDSKTGEDIEITTTKGEGGTRIFETTNLLTGEKTIKTFKEDKGRVRQTGGLFFKGTEKKAVEVKDKKIETMSTFIGPVQISQAERDKLRMQGAVQSAETSFFDKVKDVPSKLVEKVTGKKPREAFRFLVGSQEKDVTKPVTLGEVIVETTQVPIRATSIISGFAGAGAEKIAPESKELFRIKEHEKTIYTPQFGTVQVDVVTGKRITGETEITIPERIISTPTPQQVGKGVEIGVELTAMGAAPMLFAPGFITSGTEAALDKERTIKERAFGVAEAGLGGFVIGQKAVKFLKTPIKSSKLKQIIEAPEKKVTILETKIVKEITKPKIIKGRLEFSQIDGKTRSVLVPKIKGRTLSTEFIESKEQVGKVFEIRKIGREPVKVFEGISEVSGEGALKETIKFGKITKVTKVPREGKGSVELFKGGKSIFKQEINQVAKQNIKFGRPEVSNIKVKKQIGEPGVKIQDVKIEKGGKKVDTRKTSVREDGKDIEIISDFEVPLKSTLVKSEIGVETVVGKDIFSGVTRTVERQRGFIDIIQVGPRKGLIKVKGTRGKLEVRTRVGQEIEFGIDKTFDTSIIKQVGREKISAKQITPKIQRDITTISGQKTTTIFTKPDAKIVKAEAERLNKILKDKVASKSQEMLDDLEKIKKVALGMKDEAAMSGEKTKKKGLIKILKGIEDDRKFVISLGAKEEVGSVVAKSGGGKTSKAFKKAESSGGQVLLEAEKTAAESKFAFGQEMNLPRTIFVQPTEELLVMPKSLVRTTEVPFIAGIEIQESAIPLISKFKTRASPSLSGTIQFETTSPIEVSIVRPSLQQDIRVGLDTKLDTRLDTRVGTRLDTRLDTKLDTRLDTRLDTKLDTKLDTRLDTKLDTRLDTKVRTLTKQLTKQQQQIKTDILTRQIQRPLQKSTQKKPTTIKPIIKPTTSLVKRLAKKVDDEDLFEIFTRKEGKDIVVAKAKTEAEAFKKLKGKLTGSLRASGFVEKAGKKIAPPILLNGDFRRSKVDTFRVVEKRAKRLRKGTTGKEVQMFRAFGVGVKKKKSRGQFGI